MTLPFMLRELNVVELRYRAVLEVLSGVSVIEVAERYRVARHGRSGQPVSSLR